jgi:hypothetical protein
MVIVADVTEAGMRVVVCPFWVHWTVAPLTKLDPLIVSVGSVVHIPKA